MWIIEILVHLQKEDTALSCALFDTRPKDELPLLVLKLRLILRKDRLSIESKGDYNQPYKLYNIQVDDAVDAD